MCVDTPRGTASYGGGRDEERKRNTLSANTDGRRKEFAKKEEFIHLLLEQTAIDLLSTQQMSFSLQRVGVSENIFVCVCVSERRMSFWQFRWLRCLQWGGGRKSRKEKKKAANWVGDKMIYGRSERRDKWQNIRLQEWGQKKNKAGD